MSWRVPPSASASAAGGPVDERKGSQRPRGAGEQEAGGEKDRDKHKEKEKDRDDRRVPDIKLDKGTKQLLKLHLRVGLNSQQRVRDIEGTLYDVAIIKATHPVLVKMLETGRGYHEQAAKVKGPEEAENLGPPHPHIWMAMLEEITKQDIGGSNRGTRRSSFRSTRRAAPQWSTAR